MKRILLLSLLVLASCSNEEESIPTSLNNTRWYDGTTNRCGRTITWEFKDDIFTETYNTDYGYLENCEVSVYKTPYYFDGDSIVFSLYEKYKVEIRENTLTYHRNGSTTVWYKY